MLDATLYKMYISHMKTFQELIDKWPNLADFCRDVSVPYERGRKWYSTNSIPHGYANTVVSAAQKRGLDTVTLKLLAELAEKRKSTKGKETAAA